MKIPPQLWQQIRSVSLEITLFALAVFAFAFLLVAEIRWPVWEILPEWLIDLLTHNATKSIISSVSASVVAAYVFYVFVELLPRVKRRIETLRYLDTLLFVVLDAFNDKSIGGPTLPLSVSFRVAQGYKSGLTLEFVSALKDKLNESNEECNSGCTLNPYEQIAAAIDARLPILGLATSMANELSLHQGLIWSDITEHFRQISLESANTMVPTTNDERRKGLLIAAVIPRLEDWLLAR